MTANALAAEPAETWEERKQRLYANWIPPDELQKQIKASRIAREQAAALGSVRRKEEG